MFNNKIRVQIALLFVLVSLMVSPVVTQGFGTGASWNTRSNISYSIDPFIDSQLGISNSSTWIISAASRWNSTTTFDFISQNWDGSGNFVSGVSLLDNYPCNGTAYGMVANTCIIANPTTIFQARTYLNANRSVVQWNINNVNNSSTNPKQQDIDSIMTHEFGHWMKLNHNLAISTMNLTNIAPRRDVFEDDKRGVAQLYGPYTGFDNGRATGIENYSTFNKDVEGYASNTYPELAVRGSELGVNPIYGDKMLLLAGDALSSNAYIYFKSFSNDFNNDAEAGTPRGMTIQNGMYLKWCQYNFIQRTMSVDAYLTDDYGNISSLRDNPSIVDQYGRRIGPAYRNDPTGNWYCFAVNLSSLAGKRVLHWYVAFDNSRVGTAGREFRAYFDSFKVVWLGGKQ